MCYIIVLFAYQSSAAWWHIDVPTADEDLTNNSIIQLMNATNQFMNAAPSIEFKEHNIFIWQLFGNR